MRCLKETHFMYKATHRLKVKEWQKIFHKKEPEESWGSDTYVLGKRDLKPGNKR